MAADGLLKVDYDDLAALDQNLTSIVTTMEGEEHMSTLADAVGDERLADKLRSFGSSWSIHRGNIRENLVWLRDSVRQIHTDMAQTDADLASGLKGD